MNPNERVMFSNDSSKSLTSLTSTRTVVLGPTRFLMSHASQVLGRAETSQNISEQIPSKEVTLDA
jgi:hypothetical protein